MTDADTFVAMGLLLYVWLCFVSGNMFKTVYDID